MSKIMKILVMVATCLAVGFFAGLFTQAGVREWFPMLAKPSFNPPNWVFAPVWSLLYILMGIAAGLVWSRMDVEHDRVRRSLVYFWIQLALNALWSALFFGLRNPFLALIEIVLLWLMIYETWFRFKRIDKTAGWLFVPYLAWVTFASALNLSIWWLNR